ncbi:MAG: hypothetical protein GXO37_04895 [Chloroflexi bacterium]|nr:hypothetical protein [Chloroflexota bacterium]
MPPAEAEGETEAAVPGELPPWLTMAQETESEAPAAAEETPPAEAEVAGEAQEEPAAETEWLPPWLDQETAAQVADAQVPAEFEPRSETSPSPEPETEIFDPARLTQQTGELALSDEEIQALLGEETPAEPPPPPEELFQDLETPSEEEEEAPPELDRAQVPEWLRQAAPVTAEPTPRSVVDEILEGAVEGEDEDAPEALVGIPDVLPAVPEVARPRVRSRAPLTLRLTRRQEQRAQWLQELLQAEKQPRDLGAPWSALRFGWLRALVGLLLILAVALLAASPRGVHAPLTPHPAWRGVWEAIASLPPQAPVLVVSDTSWATAPEMRRIVRPVQTHLLRQQAQVLQIATVPWGVGVLTSSDAAFDPAADLGYVPGGAVLMAQLQRALPYALTGGARPWPPEGKTAWQTVRGLDQTALVVVVTDSPEQARLWVEQTAPQLASSASGLAFVLSSQAGPWFEPYLATPGVRGAVIGVEAGLAYDQALGLDAQVTQSLWHRYQGVWALATVLMPVAGASAFLLQRIARRERRKKAG